MKKDDLDIIDFDDTKNITLLSEEIEKKLCESDKTEDADSYEAEEDTCEEDTHEVDIYETEVDVYEEDTDAYEAEVDSYEEDADSYEAEEDPYEEDADSYEYEEDTYEEDSYEEDADSYEDEVSESREVVFDTINIRDLDNDLSEFDIDFVDEDYIEDEDDLEDEDDSILNVEADDSSDGNDQEKSENDCEKEETVPDEDTEGSKESVIIEENIKDGATQEVTIEDSELEDSDLEEDDYYADEDYADYEEIEEKEELPKDKPDSKKKSSGKKSEVKSPEEAALLYADEQFVENQDNYIEEGYVEDYLEDGEIDFDDEIEYTDVDDLDLEDDDDEIDPGMMDDDEYEAYEEEQEKLREKEPKELTFAERLKKKIVKKIKKLKPVDYMLYGLGAAIFIVAMVILFSLGGPTAKDTSLYQIGEDYASLGLIGTDGINNMSLHAMEVVNNTPAAEENAEVKEEEIVIDASEIKVTFVSFDKDIKIKFLANEQNRLISDVEFEITLTYLTNDNKNQKSGTQITLKDEDKDGIIKKEGVEGGDYSITIKDVPGSKFVDVPEVIKVKGAIEYQVIDVSDEIKKESEINAAVEDTKINAVVEETPTVTDTVEYIESSKSSEGDNAEEFTEIKFEDINIPPIAYMGSEVWDSYCELNDYLSAYGNRAEAYMDMKTIIRGPFITVNSYPETMKVGEKVDITITAGENGQVSWSQQGNYVELSNQSGDGVTIKAVAPGLAYICATWTNVETGTTDETSFNINVVDEEKKDDGGTGDDNAAAELSGIKLSSSEISLKAGSKEKVSITASYENGNSENVSGGLWSSDNEAVATANDDGTITAIGEGEATVTVTYTHNGVTKTATLKVTVSAEKKDENSDGNSEEKKDGDGEKNYSTDAKLTTKNGSVEVYVYDESLGTYRIATGADYKSTNKFYIKNTEVQYTYRGWQNIDGNTYYFDKDGKKVTGTQIIQGVTYNFDSDGILITNTSGIKGIDVSKWNGSIDWNAVKASGINFVIIRCGYRGSSTGALIEDPTFRTNVAGAKAAGLKVGIYFFTQAINEAEAIEEASMAVSLARQVGGVNYPIFIDTEDSGGRADRLDKATRTTVCRAFCQTVQSSGYAAGVYASKSWFQVKVDYGSLSAYKIWLAQYASQATLGQRYDLWQYSSKGSVPGIKGNVDMNISYLGY